ncbi:MAG: aspartate aminotransferase family protein [Bacillus sp. (in: firmicutes)]
MTNLSREELIELDRKFFIHPTSSIQKQHTEGASFIFTEGEGIYLKDISGKKVIDGMSSLWNVNVGHGRKELAETASAQMEKLAFSSAMSTFSHEPAIVLAEKLATLTPGDLNAVFFTSGGSESNDSAFKLAKHYWRIKGEPQKNKIISREKAYHGISMGATSATGIKEFWNMSGTKSPDFLHAAKPVNNYYGSERLSDSELDEVQSIRSIINEEGPDTIAAFIAEPIQGAGGMIVPSDEYFKQVRTLCDEYNILFIADEVITGFGRTGKMFCTQHWNVVPDIMTIAKGITSGYVPLGGVCVSKKVHDTLIELSAGTLFHGFTYSGHPTACAVALKNIEIIEKENLVENSKERGEQMLKGFLALKNEFEIVGNVRSMGLLGAFDLMRDPDLGIEFSTNLQIASKFVEHAADRGLVCRSVTYDGKNTIVLAPPLIINTNQMDDIIGIIRETILEVKKELALAL